MSYNRNVNIDPRNSALYTLKYKEIIEDANKGSKSNAIALATKMKKKGALCYRGGGILTLISFFLFGFMGFSFVINFNGLTPYYFMIIPLIGFVFGGFCANYGHTLIKLSDLINTSKTDDVFSQFDNNIFCTQCGKTNDYDSKFCKSCGTSIK